MKRLVRPSTVMWYHGNPDENWAGAEWYIIDMHNRVQRFGPDKADYHRADHTAFNNHLVYSDKLEQQIRQLEKLVEFVAEQQAIPDDSWRKELVNILGE